MNETCGIYMGLLQKFVAREISASQFQSAFFTQFPNDACEMDDSLFLLLDELFGDVDSYTDNPALLAKEPDFYLDEAGLEKKAQDILARLEPYADNSISGLSRAAAVEEMMHFKKIQGISVDEIEGWIVEGRK